MRKNSHKDEKEKMTIPSFDDFATALGLDINWTDKQIEKKKEKHSQYEDSTNYRDVTNEGHRVLNDEDYTIDDVADAKKNGEANDAYYEADVDRYKQETVRYDGTSAGKSSYDEMRHDYNDPAEPHGGHYIKEIDKKWSHDEVQWESAQEVIAMKKKGLLANARHGVIWSEILQKPLSKRRR